MKILIIGTSKLDCAETNCGMALRGMGHDVRHFDPDEHPSVFAQLRNAWHVKRYVNRVLELSGLYRKLYEGALVDEAVSYQPDLVLVIPLFLVRANVIAEIKARTTARVVGWYQDHIGNLGGHEFMLADYDALFFKDRFIVDRLRNYAGMHNVHFLPESCEPTRHHSLPLSDAEKKEFGCDLMTYGNLYPYRARILEHLDDFDLRIYGERPAIWMSHRIRSRWQGYPVYGDARIRAVLAAKIVVSTSYYAEIFSANARVFEVAGIGGFQVSDSPGVAEFFEPGKEIVTFKGPKELRQVISHYLDRPSERSEIASRGQARAHRDHTYAKRLTEIFRVTGLAIVAPPSPLPGRAA